MPPESVGEKRDLEVVLIQVLGRWKQLDPWDSVASQPHLPASPRPMRDPVFKTSVDFA